MSDPASVRHVAVLAFPFLSHTATQLSLACRLSAADPSLLFSFLSTPSSLSSLAFSNDPSIQPFEIPEEKPDGEYNLDAATARFMETAKDRYREGMERAERERGVKISCLLTDAFLWFGGDLAKEMGVTWVPYWSAAGCTLSVYMNLDLIHENFRVNGTTGKANQTLSFIQGLSGVHVDYLAEGILHGILHGKFKSPIAVILHKMGQHLSQATAVVVNSFEELEPETTKDLKSKLRKVLNVGPSFPSKKSSKQDVYSCISWLDTHESSSVAYISFGTVATPPPNELLALAEALQDKKLPFLWSIKDHLLGLLPEKFIEETKGFGKIVPWAPQVEILGHPSVGVFVTHCGWNSTSESIMGGVPLICRPFFGDQNLNSLMIQDIWKIGIRVEGGLFSKNGTIKAFKSVLSSEEGKKMRESIRLMKGKAVEAVGSNGSSTTNFATLLEVIRN